jgi:predicted GIY-YIG superfamily endonuclease
MTSNKWVFYMLRCNDGSLYSGITNNLDKRLKAHNCGKGARYTASRFPANLVYSEPYPEVSLARSREYEVKSMDKKHKEQLISEATKKAVQNSGQTQRPFTRERYPMPNFFIKALKENKLLAAYEARPPYQRNDYIGWIMRAKLDTTRQKRLKPTLEELKSGTEYMGMSYSPIK